MQLDKLSREELEQYFQILKTRLDKQESAHKIYRTMWPIGAKPNLDDYFEKIILVEEAYKVLVDKLATFPEAQPILSDFYETLKKLRHK